MVDLIKNTHFLFNGFVTNMDQNFELFWQQPAFGELAISPPENNMRLMGLNFIECYMKG